MRRLSFMLLCIAFTACKITTSEIRNDIDLKAKGINVKQAFLLNESDGKLIAEGNKIEVGQQVNLRLIVEGWKAKDGKVFLGASEKITTDEGKVLLDEKDLFAAYNESGINPADAGAITLSATITQVDRLVKHFEVSFRVWDKNSSDNVTGSYRLYLK